MLACCLSVKFLSVLSSFEGSGEKGLVSLKGLRVAMRQKGKQQG